MLDIGLARDLVNLVKGRCLPSRRRPCCWVIRPWWCEVLPDTSISSLVAAERGGKRRGIREWRWLNFDANAPKIKTEHVHRKGNKSSSILKHSKRGNNCEDQMLRCDQ